MKSFFYKYWGIYYVLFFLLLGLLIYALLWTPDLSRYTKTINDLNTQLEDCNNRQPTIIVDTATTIVDNTINCDATVQSGGTGQTSTQHELGTRSGTVVIRYDMKTLPDEINVYYNNTLVASSNGLVSQTNALQFNYTAIAGRPTYCIVKISAPYDNTEWNYLLNCPQ
jgi:hypothetical protein